MMPYPHWSNREYFKDLGEGSAEAFKSMAVFDSLVANTDRHVGNFGVMRDNRTGEVLGAAPLFDHNVSLFTRDLDEYLSLEMMQERLGRSTGILEASLAWQGEAMLGDVQRAQVERLVDFAFAEEGFIAEYRQRHPGDTTAFSAQRLELLGLFVRNRAQELLGWMG